MMIYRRLLVVAMDCIGMSVGTGTATSAVVSNETFQFSAPVCNACAGAAVLIDVDLNVVTTSTSDVSICQGN